MTTINTVEMKANELAFAIAALGRNADKTELIAALVALIGQQEAYQAITAAKAVIRANQF